MACDIVKEGDFILRWKDGSSPVVSAAISLWGSASFTPGGWTLEDQRLPGGGFTSYSPTRTEEQPTVLSFTGRQIGSPGDGTQIPTLTIVQTYVSGSVQEVQIDVWAPNALAPTREVLAWTMATDLAATDNLLEAEILAELGITATNAVAGTVVAVFPAGTTVNVVSSSVTTATLSATRTYTGGTAAAEVTLADICLQSGQYPRLTSHDRHRHLQHGREDPDVGARGRRKIYSFPKGTVNAGATIGRAGIDWAVTVTSRQAYPDMSDA
jgi:hypothetical protein